MMFAPTIASRQVLLVEDDSNDILLTERTFREVDPSIGLHVASDGVDAMAFLERRGAHGRAPRPDLILLDLSLPKLDGRQVLARIKLDDDLKSIPTIVLTASENEMDMAQCYQLQANVYLTKPPGPEAFENLLKNIIDFWLTTTKLPRSAKTDRE